MSDIYKEFCYYDLTDQDKIDIIEQMTKEFPIIFLGNDYYLINNRRLKLAGLYGSYPPIFNIRYVLSGKMTNEVFDIPFEDSKTDLLCRQIHAKHINYKKTRTNRLLI